MIEDEINRLEELVGELIDAAAGIGAVSSLAGEVRGLAFLMGETGAGLVNNLLDKVDLSLPLSDNALEMLDRLQEIAADNRRLRSLSQTDALTGLFNYRHFRHCLDIELDRVKRSERPCALLIFDLDGFKSVNDEHGHQAGDRLLEDIGDIVCSNIRIMDVAVRYGGDEFAVIMPDTSSLSSYRMAERIRQTIESDPRTNQYGVTASMGISVHYHFDQGAWEELVERADQSMYKAKKAGGNRTEFLESDRTKEEEIGITVSERDSLYLALPVDDD